MDKVEASPSQCDQILGTSTPWRHSMAIHGWDRALCLPSRVRGVSMGHVTYTDARPRR